MSVRRMPDEILDKIMGMMRAQCKEASNAESPRPMLFMPVEIIVLLDEIDRLREEGGVEGGRSTG